MYRRLPTAPTRCAPAWILFLACGAAHACDDAVARRALELRVDDFAFPIERVALYESQVELRAELRLRAAGVEPRRPTAHARCLLRVAVVSADTGLRVDVTFGSADSPTYGGTEIVPASSMGRGTPDRTATATAVLAAVDRQIDRFVASLRRGDPRT